MPVLPDRTVAHDTPTAATTPVVWPRVPKLSTGLRWQAPGASDGAARLPEKGAATSDKSSASTPLRPVEKCHDSGIAPTTLGPNRPLYAATRLAIDLLLRFGENLTVEGLDNVPRTGPAIIAPNHLSVHDSTVLIGVLPRMVRFIGKSEYVDDWTTRFAFLAMGNIPVDRSSSDSAKAALDAAAAVLEAGDLFGVFPEGTRSRDGLLHKGKTGAARLSLRTKAPVVPVGLIGTDKMQAHNDPINVIRFRKDIAVRFGEPIWPSRYRSDHALAPRQMTDDIMFEIAQLSGQTYVDEYMRRPGEVA